jgi:hypothetical protein
MEKPLDGVATQLDVMALNRNAEHGDVIVL